MSLGNKHLWHHASTHLSLLSYSFFTLIDHPKIPTLLTRTKKFWSGALHLLLVLLPFLAAADSAPDQVVIGNVLASQGGGEFLSTMGVREGVQLPEGVRGLFAQFTDEYLKPENAEHTKWLWWDYLEHLLSTGSLKYLPHKVVGDLTNVQDAWDLLKEHKVSGERLIIMPN
jgi:hypothetical protein